MKEFDFTFTFKAEDYEARLEITADNFEEALEKAKSKGFNIADINYASKEELEESKPKLVRDENGKPIIRRDENGIPNEVKE